MPQIKILAQGKFKPEDIKVSLSESNRLIDPRIESQIDSVWERERNQAEKLGKVCYNGTSYRLNSLKNTNQVLEIDFGLLEYKTSLALLKIPEYFDLSEDYYRKTCYTSASVQTYDGLFVMVKLSGKSMNPNKIDFLGGMLEKPLEIQNSHDIFKALKIELKEEACLVDSDMADFYLNSIFLNNKTTICFYFEVRLNISSTDLLARFKSENQDPDINDLIFLSKDEYIKTLENFNENKKFISRLMLL